MNLLRHTDGDFAERRSKLAAASSLFDPTIEERTRAILKDVQERGDDALLDLTRRFDGAELQADQLVVSAAEKFNASLAADDDLRAAVQVAYRNIERFSKKSELRSTSMPNSSKANYPASRFLTRNPWGSHRIAKLGAPSFPSHCRPFPRHANCHTVF